MQCPGTIHVHPILSKSWPRGHLVSTCISSTTGSFSSSEEIRVVIGELWLDSFIKLEMVPLGSHPLTLVLSLWTEVLLHDLSSHRRRQLSCLLQDFLPHRLSPVRGLFLVPTSLEGLSLPPWQSSKLPLAASLRKYPHWMQWPWCILLSRTSVSLV